MSDDSEKKIEDNFKIINKITIDSRPKSYNAGELGKSTAKVNYIHIVLDKFTEKLNNQFVSQLNGVLGDNNKSMTGLKNTLGDSEKRLVEELDGLKSKIKILEEAGNDGSGLQWEAAQLQYTDTELI